MDYNASLDVHGKHDISSFDFDHYVMDPDFILKRFCRAFDNSDLRGIFCFDSDVEVDTGEQQQLSVHIIESSKNNVFEEKNVTELVKGKKRKVNPSI